MRAKRLFDFIAYIGLPLAVLPVFAAGAPSSDTSLNFATGLMVREEHALAIDELKSILEKDPGFERMAVVLSRLGECYYRTGAEAEAIATFERLTKQHPDSTESPMALYRLGRLHSEGTPERSAEAFSLLAARFPEHNLAPTALYWAGDALMRLERFAEAEKTFGRLIEAFPDSEVAEHARYTLGWAILRQQDRLVDAQKAFEAFIAAHPESELRIAAALKSAECRYRLGHHEEALKSYRSLMDEPGAAGRDAALGAAWSLFDLKRFDDAIESFLLAAERETDADREALHRFNAANAAARTDAFERAADLFADVTTRFPKHALSLEARDWQGRCLGRAGKHAESALVLEALVTEIGAGETKPAALYALAEARTALGKHPQSAETFSTIAKHHPKDTLAPAALYAAVLEWEKAKQPAKAIEQAENLLEKYPESDLAEPARFAMGSALFRLGNHAEALETFEAMKNTPPEVVKDRLYQMAWARFHLKDYDRALDAFDTLAKAGPDDRLTAEARYMAGRVALTLGKPQVARERFEAAANDIGLSPFGARAVLALATLKMTEASGAKRSEERFEAVVKLLAPLLERDDLPREIYPHARLTLAQALQALERHAETLAVLDGHTKAEGALGNDLAFALAWSQYRGDNADAALEGFTALSQGDGTRAADAAFIMARILETRDAPRAVSAYAAFEKRFPKHEGAREARYRKAMMLVQADETDTAAAAFARIAHDDPQSPFAAPALYDLAWLRFQAGDTEDERDAAAAVFADLVQRFPEHRTAADARFRLGEIAQARGDKRQALEHYLAVREDERFEEKDTLEYRIGWCFLDLEQFREAAEAFETLANGFPDKPLAEEARYRAGMCRQKTDEHAKAIAWFDSVSGEDFVERARFAAAESERAAGNHRAAIERYRDLLGKHPGGRFTVQATLGLAHALRSAEAYADALEAYGRVTAMTDTIEAAQACMGSGYCRLAMNQPREAAREFLKVDIVYGYDELKPEALRMLILCFERLKDADRVERYRRELETRFP